MAVSFVIQVSGRVQGVGFRYYTKLEADRLGLKGTVVNEADGTVSIRVIGEKSIVQKFLNWCHKGPSTALVDKLVYEPTQVEEYTGFEIIR